jgi:hypothetical protein
MSELLIEVVGWTGAALVLSAYFLITSKKVKAESKLYHSLNLFGGLFIVINTLYHSAYPSVALNSIWSIIALYGIAKGLKK